MSPSATSLALAALAAAPPPPEVRVIDEKERVRLQQTDVVRLSLPTQADVDAWASPGLRVALGYGYGSIQGRGAAFSFDSHSFALRPSVRLDAHWGAGLTMMYSTGPNGLRWSVTAEPTFYPWRQLALSIGVGFGGLMVTDFTIDNSPSVGGDDVGRDLAQSEQLGECHGSAFSSLARAEYQFVAGSLFSSGPFVQGLAQVTRCLLKWSGDGSSSTVYSQWWTMTGYTFGWWLSWR